MTKKHFISLAEIIGKLRRESKTNCSKEQLIKILENEIVQFCAENNQNFMPSVFFSRIEIEENK